MDIYRQGDVVISPAKIPKEAKLTGTEIRISSETGRPHVIQGKAFSSGAQQYILLEEETQLTHPQHPTRTLPAGSYAVRTIRDYMPRRMDPD